MFLVAVPITPLYTFTGRWLFGNILCKIFSASQVVLYGVQGGTVHTMTLLQGVAVYMSTLTLTAIAIDR